MVADVAIDIRIDEIRARTREPFDGGLELFPILRAIDIDEGKVQHAGLGGGPAQGEALIAFREEDGAVAGDPGIDLDGRAVFDPNDFALGAGLLHLSAEEVTAGAIVELLEVKVLHVEMEISDAPRDPLIVT